jgi:hypothetical protein
LLFATRADSSDCRKGTLFASYLLKQQVSGSLASSASSSQGSNDRNLNTAL